jgi:hypothetical protein
MQFPEILHNHKNVVGRGMVGAGVVKVKVKERGEMDRPSNYWTLF